MMRYDRTKIPKNLQELIDFGWTTLMRAKIRQYCLNDVNNSEDDILQDMFVQMLEQNYIERYDACGRPFDVYICIFIRNFMSKRWKKEKESRNGAKIIFAKGLENTMPDESELDSSKVYLEKLYDGGAEFEDALIYQMDLKKELAEMKANSSVMKDGILYERDPKTALQMYMDGYSVPEIAKTLETSPQFVYILLRKARSCEVLKDVKYRTRGARCRTT